jgi:iron complex outermembrane receptor protein/outer membrane receptor for ferrienterochelin and colicins
MKRILLLIALFITTLQSQAQNPIHKIVLIAVDSISNSPVPFFTAFQPHENLGGNADENGKINLVFSITSDYKIIISAVGYEKKTVQFSDAELRESMTVKLSPLVLDEVIVSSTRTNARIEDLPIKIEVLGQEEMDEESSIVPGGIGSLLGDLSVITVQKTDPVNSNDAIRIQGLESKYTKIIKDGFPLYDGFSGSLGVLSIPPLDLQQVEIIKGCGSTLYGESAIGGVINFISKTPTDSLTGVVVGNHTSLNENNLNFFAGQKKNKFGYTLFLGGNQKEAVDINKDGFMEVPKDRNYIIHPRLFYENKNLKINVGYNFNYDNRESGLISAITNGITATNNFHVIEKYIRNTADLTLDYKINDQSSLHYKSAASFYSRNYSNPAILFNGKENNTYQELNIVSVKGKHTAVAGFNLITSNFTHASNDSLPFGNFNTNTIGVFLQDDYKLSEKVMIDLGYRFDYANKNAVYLPSAGFFIKPNKDLSIRIRYASGYRKPAVLNELDITEYRSYQSSNNNLLIEKSNGYNTDINCSVLIGNKVHLDLNQAFYYTDISNPAIAHKNYLGDVSITNESGKVKSYGTDTYIRLSLEDWELYLGYNHTIAYREGQNQNYQLPFNPNDKFAITLAYEIEDKWRMGIEAAYNANQVNASYKQVPNYWFTAAMIERKINRFSIVLNCENVNNFKQSNYEKLVNIDSGTPAYTDIWGPIEGRVVNLSLKYKF